MFKRRKPDEGPETPDGGAAKPPVGMPSPSPFPKPVAPPGVSGGPSAAPPSKESTIMGRTPFPSPQPPSGNPPPGQPQVGMPGAAPRPVGPIASPAPRPAATAERRTLVVGRGISVQGTVQDAERLVVEGTVEASMIRATELSIAQGGVFKGAVEVEEAEIAGTIDGTLTARGAVLVRSTGKVLGTANYRRLQVEDGGQITGELKMITGESRPEAPKASTDTAA